MKWRSALILLLVVLGTLVLTHKIALAVFPAYKEALPAWLLSLTSDVQVTFRVTHPGWVGPPTDLTATYVSDNVVSLKWTVGANAENTTLRAKMGSYPDAIDDGYVVFDGPGTSANDTALDFDSFLGIVKYRAWSENATGSYSVEYADAELENPHVSTMASLFTLLWPIGVLLCLIVVGSLLRAGFVIMLAGIGMVVYSFNVWATLDWLSIILFLAGGIIFAVGLKT